MRRPMSLPMLFGVLLLAPVLAVPAAQTAAARTACDSYGRCFDFSGPSDRLGGLEALWRRADASGAVAESPVAESPVAESSITEPAAVEAPAVDPLALAHGTIGDSLQAPDDDD